MNDRVEALRAAHSATILAFESSCDETAVAIVRDGRKSSPTRFCRKSTATPYSAAWCRKSPRACM